MTREIKYSDAILEATDYSMASDSTVFIIGLGVPDPKGVFGTTQGLQEKFGAERVFDMPTSENAMTGIGIGAALYGMRPIMTHQRLDFALLSMDQLVNNAAKWRFMFGGQRGVPLTVRMIFFPCTTPPGVITRLMAPVSIFRTGVFSNISTLPPIFWVIPRAIPLI